MREALSEGRLKRVGKLLHRTHPAKVAGLLEALPPDERREVWSMVETDRAGKVLTFLHEEICAALAQQMEPGELAASAHFLELDDLVDLIQSLPTALGAQLLVATGGSRRQQLEALLSYPEDTAGGMMNADPIEVRADVRVGTVMRYLRLLETLPPQTDMLMVLDRHGLYQGVLRLSTLVTANTETRVSDLMQDDIAGIPLDMPASEVAQLFEDLDLLSAPVLDAAGRLVGRITVDDVVDQIREDSDRTVMQMAGLDQEADMFGPVLGGLAQPGRVAGHQPDHGLAGRRGDRPFRGHAGAAGGPGRAHAHCGQHGRHCGQPDAHAGDPWPGPGADSERQLRACCSPARWASRPSTGCCGRW